MNPALPPELELLICQTAISDYEIRYRTLLNIILVAHRFQEWFEPELYRIVRCGSDNIVYPPIYMGKLNDDNDAPPSLNIPLLTKWGPHVRCLLLQSRSPMEVETVLSYCTDLTSLAIWAFDSDSDSRPYATIVSLINKLPNLEKLSLQFDTIFAYEGESSISLNKLTSKNRLSHFDLVDLPLNWSAISELSTFPRLSHICVNGSLSAYTQVLLCILEHCKALELLVIYGDHDDAQLEPHEREIFAKELRFVGMDPRASDLQDWDDGVTGKEDFWAFSELLQAQKKSLSIEDLAIRMAGTSVVDSRSTSSADR